MAGANPTQALHIVFGQGAALFIIKTMLYAASIVQKNTPLL